MNHHVNERIDFLYGITCALSLRAPHVALAVDDLALQIRFINHVEFHDAEGSHACCCQVHQSRTAQAARTYAQHLRILQTLLTRHAHIRDDEVTAIPANFFQAEGFSWLHERWQGHRYSLIGRCA